MAGAALAQETATPPAKTQEQTKPAEQAAPAKTETQSPVPSGEEWLTGNFELGYRWVSDVRGSLPTYRTIVDQRNNFTLTGLDFTITDPRHRWFDRLDARAVGWGGEPYNTAHVDLEKRGLWEFTADYRNIAYFNAVPSFANPFAPVGFDEQAFDIRKRFGYARLQLFPGKHIMPYLAFERNANYGHGVATWVQDANDEFAVPTLLRDSTNNYRGGVQFEYNHYHVTLEQGGTTYKNDDTANANGVNFGDRLTPVLGGTEALNTLRQAYGVRGTSVYSKVLASATPFRWLDLSGQFLWSDPKTDARYFDVTTGNFALVSALLLYPGQLNLSSSSASAPHVLANAGIELRPWSRLRIIHSWTTNRYHDAGFGALTEQILQSPGTGPSIADILNARQVVNYNQEQVQAVFEVNRKMAVRGGQRHEWGDATVRAGRLDPAGRLQSRELDRNVGLAGATIRPWPKLSANLDYEGAKTDRDYFRTSLYNYHRMRARAKYQATASLSLQANFALLDNQNPTAGIQYDFRSRDNSLSVYWTPSGGKRFVILAEYDRSTLRSRLDYLLLPFLTPAVSVYRENGHTATSAIDVALPAIGGLTLRISVGGSLFLSAGVQPTQYYQPLGRLSLPLHRHLQWNTEWRWYGFGESFYQYEAFRAHTFLTGIRVNR
jgi:hypothetical protein